MLIVLLLAACAGPAPAVERARASDSASPSAAAALSSGAATVVGSPTRASTASSPPPPSVIATPAATPEPDVPACTAGQLEARATAQPGTGGWQLMGAIVFFNRGVACGLRGAPAVRPIDPHGALIDVQGAEPARAGRLVVLKASSATWTPPESAPLGGGVLTFTWSGACLERGAVAFRVTLPDDRGTLDAPFLSLVGTRIGAPGAMPRCAEPGRTLTGYLSVDPFFAMGE